MTTAEADVSATATGTPEATATGEPIESATTGENPTPADGGDGDKPAAHIQAAIDAALEADRAAQRTIVEAETRQKMAEEAAATAAQQTAEAVVNKARDAVITRMKAKGIADTDIAEALGTTLPELHGEISAVEARNMSNAVAEAAMAIIPEDQRADFVKNAAGKPLGEWMQHVIEHGAPASQAWAQREREHTAALKAERAAGFEEGAVSPSGVPSQTGTRTGTPQRYATMDQLTKARAEGQIPDDQQFLAEQNRLLGIASN